MTQVAGNNFPSTPDTPRDTLPGAVPPLGGDDLNIPFVPDEEPKDRKPSPETEGPLNPQQDREKSPDA